MTDRPLFPLPRLSSKQRRRRAELAAEAALQIAATDRNFALLLRNEVLKDAPEDVRQLVVIPPLH